MSTDSLGRERKTHCAKGHPYDDANTYWHKNWKGYDCRGCRACVREAVAVNRTRPGVLAAQAAKQARWRKSNPEEYKRRYQAEYERKKQILTDARIDGCIVCGEKDVACLDFHHRNGKTDKLGHIGTFRKFGTERLLAEIAKCDVLCSNCHRRHHRDERQNAV
jgi:hypothetical protein